MNLPISLMHAIENEIANINPDMLQKAVSDLSVRYRDASMRANISVGKQLFMTSELHRMAYIATRMPATFGAVKAALLQLHTIFPTFAPSSLLDIGAGPGTASWAAASLFSSLSHFTLFEQDSSLISIGKKLALDAEYPSLKKATWKTANLLETPSFPSADLIIASYAFNELPLEKTLENIKALWDSCQVLAIVEPGTMQGFGTIRAVRARLLELKAYLAAPCPHHQACPMPQNDWCHFAARISRTSSHRQAKGADLGYEDEKYSYVIAAKEPQLLPQARILRHPQKHSGHLAVTLCTEQGLVNQTISRRHGALYKKARKWEWGDTIYHLD